MNGLPGVSGIAKPSLDGPYRTLSIRSGVRSSLLSVARPPFVRQKTRGFASPPRGGFAFIVDISITQLRISGNPPATVVDTSKAQMKAR